MALAISLSDEISLQNFQSFENCQHQWQWKVFTVCSHVEMPLKFVDDRLVLPHGLKIYTISLKLYGLQNEDSMLDLPWMCRMTFMEELTNLLQLSTTTLSIMTFSIKTLSINGYYVTFSITTQHKGIICDTQHKWPSAWMTLSTTMLCYYVVADCHYA
jgi:hypothetical protein